MKNKRIRNILILMVAMVLLAGPGRTLVSAETKILTIALEDWSSEIASANVVKAVLKNRLNTQCILKRMSVTDQYEAVSNGTVDVMLGAWLPSQKQYYMRYEGQFNDLGPNLEGAKMGLVVPAVSSTWLVAEDGQHTEPYMRIDSIEELDKHYDDFGGKIIGIEEDSGMMKIMREKLMPAYGLERFELVPGNEVTMTAQLTDAIKKKKWIVVLGWAPHWKFGRWNLKFLKDPKQIWPDTVQIHTLVRKGLETDMPKIHAFLDKFFWTSNEMEQVLVWNEMKNTPYDNAQRWMNYNKERVNSWFK